MFLAMLFNPCFKGKIEILQGVKKKKKESLEHFLFGVTETMSPLYSCSLCRLHFERSALQMNREGTCWVGT